MILKTGLFRAARKKLSLTHDNDMGAFREKLNVLVEQKDSLSEDEINAKVDELKDILVDLPDSEDKSKLDRFLEDFRAVKEQDANVAKEAAGQVADLFEKLDVAAMEDTPAAVETDEPVETEEEVDEVVEETVAPEGEEEAEDADPNPQYSLDEIYEYIKRRMGEEAEDAALDEGDDEVIEEEQTDDIVEDEEEDDEECVTDHAPRIAVKITKDNAGTKGGLLDLFNSVKGVN